ncbi:T9SS type A sorting domain-containing protein [Rufibacter roseus]|uniref:T9SS type A sorting domain-containing protein n=1 Tax=Rufibacter roseus TaxID=1567108 RepID=A0ABW2DF51_9BACT|nr:T9SS type A sorting domain-containing protein [Rufibacter roseus]
MKKNYTKFSQSIKILIASLLLLSWQGILNTGLVMAQGTTTHSWVEKTTGAPPQVRTLYAVNENVVWGLTNGVSGFVKTTDGGETWETGQIDGLSNSGTGNISAVSATEAFAAVYPNGAGATSGIYHTTDGGQTWSKQPTASYSDPASFPNFVTFFDGTNGVAGGDALNGYFEIYTTSNLGQTWTRVPNANMPAALAGEWGFINSFIDNGNSVWFGTNKGRIFRSTDKGLNWTVSTLLPNNSTVSAMAFSDNGTGFAVGVEDGSGRMFSARTSDGGENWSAFVAEEPAGLYVNSIAYVPGTASTFVITGAAAGKNGSAVSTDGGANWTMIDQGVAHSEVVFVNPTTGWTGGPGVMYKFSGAFASVTGIEDELDGRLSVYPNPSTTEFTVELSTSAKSARVVLYNMNGQPVLNQVLQGPSQTLSVGHLPKGVYVLNLVENQTVIKRKVVVQ